MSRSRIHACVCPAGFSVGLLFAAAVAPCDAGEVVFAEKNGIVAVEAEHYSRQTNTRKRAFFVTASNRTPRVSPDGDPQHVAGASGGAYLEVLPDTRRTHRDKLIAGENFSNAPGKLAVLHYKVHFSKPGRYYVWVRAYSTGSEDNGLHVGIDGTWPESGRRLQWCKGKNTWRWDSMQRTKAKHCGVPHQIYLDVKSSGEHDIQFSMREDGFEFDKWLMTTDREFKRPTDAGPAVVVKSGKPTLPTDPEVASAARSTTSAKPQKNQARAPVKRLPHGKGAVVVSGEKKRWHKVTLTLDGPFAHERDSSPNPFIDYRMTVKFTHASGSPEYVVPGYFAADGDAANSSAESGVKWRAHLSPDRTGEWSYRISFVKGKQAAVDGKVAGTAVKPYDGITGTLTVGKTDKSYPDFRAQGRLQYVGRHYLRFAGTGEYFLKAGPDAPETLLAYRDFDGTVTRKTPLKTWSPHLRDWKSGNPTWKGHKGKGLIGALNYLAAQECNAFSFLTYNAGGDGDNIWPFVDRNEKLHYDCSKLHQWQIVFDHAQTLGLYLHFKMQEQENDDNRRGGGKKKSAKRKKQSADGKRRDVPAALDGGDLGVERRLYCRELIARFGHSLALNWNLGEENTQSTAQQKAMAGYLRQTDPYRHHIVVHTFPNAQDRVYSKLLGKASPFTGASLQNSWDAAHRRTLKWVRESAKAGKPWVVANDEQGPATLGVPPDPGYAEFNGKARQRDRTYDLHDIRKSTLWGTLMAGGAGVEYYFGYKLPQNDLICEDFRSREQSWKYCRIATRFFREQKIPLAEMSNADELVGNAQHDNSRFCFAKPGKVYLVYLSSGGEATLDLSAAQGRFSVHWFNPRTGGALVESSVKTVRGGGSVKLGRPPADADEDWLAVVRAQ